MFEIFKIKSRKKSLEQEIEALEQRISEANTKLKIKELAYDKKLKEFNDLDRELANLRQQCQKCKDSISESEGIIEMQEFGLEYTPISINLDEISAKKNKIQRKIAKLFGNNEVILTTRVYRVDGSESKGRVFQKTYCENLLTGFTNYFEKKKKAVTANNFNKTIDLLNSFFTKTNKKADLLGVCVNSKYYDACLDLLQIELDEKIAKREEREKLKEERRIIREQEKLLQEAEKEHARLLKERKMYQDAFAKAVSEEEKQEFEAKLKEIDKREADIDYRINNQRAGYLYIAETRSMPGLVKIGATRMLNPLARLYSLSSTSVPFPFVCCGFVFNDDVFSLEKSMHDYFDSKRVGATKHKEFFKISPKEAIDVLRNEFKCEVHFAKNEDEIEENDDEQDSE